MREPSEVECIADGRIGEQRCGHQLGFVQPHVEALEGQTHCSQAIEGSENAPERQLTKTSDQHSIVVGFHSNSKVLEISSNCLERWRLSVMLVWMRFARFASWKFVIYIDFIAFAASLNR